MQRSRRAAIGIRVESLDARIVLSVAPYVIPLELVDVSKPGSARPEYKLGIYVGLGGGAPKLYEFDTGGSGFFAAYTSDPKGGQWWGETDLVGKRSLKNSYSSGNTFVANEVLSTVELYAHDADTGTFTSVVGTDIGVAIGQIVRYSNPKKPQEVRAWYRSLAEGDAPLQKHFYGDFGASLAPSATPNGGTVFSVLPQIPVPEGLKPGYLIHLGSLDSNAQPYLQIGLNESDINSADTTLRMNRFEARWGQQFPITNLPTYSQQITTADFSWSNPKTGDEQRFTNLGWTIDTGAKTVDLWQGSRLRVHRGFVHKPTKSHGFAIGRMKDGRVFSVEASSIGDAGKPLQLVIDPTGTTPSVNLVKAKAHGSKHASHANYVNTGLLTFVRYDIMVELAAGKIHFRTASSE